MKRALKICATKHNRFVTWQQQIRDQNSLAPVETVLWFRSSILYMRTRNVQMYSRCMFKVETTSLPCETRSIAMKQKSLLAFFFAKRYFTVACTYVYVCQPKLTVCVNDLTSIHVCYQCLMLSVPDATSTWCYQCLMRPVPDATSAWC